MSSIKTVDGTTKVPSPTLNLAKEFLESYDIIEASKADETDKDAVIFLHLDKKSDAFYMTCHLYGEDISELADLNASIEGDDENNYKLNRDLHMDKSAFLKMKVDATAGRSFEDIVLEYDPSYNEGEPLKVYGGQHRVEAIKAANLEDVSVPHGVRVYFNLSQEQKVEIALVNNTSIAVSNDLLDRMSEHLAGPELRIWCQESGLLPENMDFKDKGDAVYPTVRIARTLILNYLKGKDGNIKEINDARLAKAGGADPEFDLLREGINWTDKNLLKMGKAYAKLHKAQMKAVKDSNGKLAAQYSKKALSLSVVASWAFAAGLFQKAPDRLEILYNLPDKATSKVDPLNAKALSEARLPGVDPDNYRGLGTRVNSTEIGRMLEVFILLCDKNKARITKDLANAGISNFEFKRNKKLNEDRLKKL